MIHVNKSIKWIFSSLWGLTILSPNVDYLHIFSTAHTTYALPPVVPTKLCTSANLFHKFRNWCTHLPKQYASLQSEQMCHPFHIRKWHAMSLIVGGISLRISPKNPLSQFKLATCAQTYYNRNWQPPLGCCLCSLFPVFFFCHNFINKHAFSSWWTL